MQTENFAAFQMFWNTPCLADPEAPEQSLAPGEFLRRMSRHAAAIASQQTYDIAQQFGLADSEATQAGKLPAAVAAAYVRAKTAAAALSAAVQELEMLAMGKDAADADIKNAAKTLREAAAYLRTRPEAELFGRMRAYAAAADELENCGDAVAAQLKGLLQ